MFFKCLADYSKEICEINAQNIIVNYFNFDFFQNTFYVDKYWDLNYR